MLTTGDAILGLSAVRVGDVSVAMHSAGRSRFLDVVNQLDHSGTVYLTPGVSAVYPGFDLQVASDYSISMSHVSFASNRLQLLEKQYYLAVQKQLAPPS